MNTGSWKPFAWCAAFCLALVLMLPPPSWARPGVDGRNVTMVFTPNAKFRLLTSKRWVEEGSGGATLYFVEENRDAWSVYLFDASRGVRLHLDLYQKQVYFSDSANPKRALYPISDDSAEVRGWNVSWVSSREGQFRMTGPKQWVGSEAGGNTFNFVEENRDEWSVYLFEATRGVRLQLDLLRRQVFGSDKTTLQRLLYAVTNVSATDAPPASSPPVASYPAPTAPYPAPTSGDINLAIGKAVQQSSTDYGGDARRAVDGNTNGAYSSNSVSHTGDQAQPWWQVDLGTVQAIKNIRLWNRTDCCADRLSRFYVFVSDYPFSSDNLNATFNQPGVSRYFYGGVAGPTTDISVNRTGRFVRVQLEGTNNLQLAEVEVFSSAGVAPGYAPYPAVNPAYPTYPNPPLTTGYPSNPTPYSPPPDPNAGYYGNPPGSNPGYPAYTPPAPVYSGDPSVNPNVGSVPVACSPNTCGSVEAVNVQQVAGEGSGLGAIIGGLAGAALGHQVGRGSGRDVATIAGAVAGAIAGHQIERSKTGTRYDVAVRLDDGSLRMFSFDAAPPFRVGDRVIDAGGRLQNN